MSSLVVYLATSGHTAVMASGRALAAPLADPSTSNLRGWLKDNVVQLLFLLIGISILIAGYRGSASKVMMTAGLSLVGLLWIGMAASNHLDSVSNWLMNMTGLA